MVGTDAIAWAVLALFFVGTLVSPHRARFARGITASGWLLFAGFWLSLVPHFAFVQRSGIEAVLAGVAVPLCLYVAGHVWRGRQSLQVLSRAVAVMGLIYLPATTLAVVRVPLVELVTQQVAWSLSTLGYTPEVAIEAGVRNVFVFRTPEGHVARSVEILLACTGLGSMAIFAGLIAAVDAPLSRKLRAVVVTIPTIWVLNIVRNVFITLAYGNQWLQVAPDYVLWAFGADHPELVSFLLADRVIAQTLSVLVVVGLLLVVSRELPEVRVIVGDLLVLTTGNDYGFTPHRE